MLTRTLQLVTAGQVQAPLLKALEEPLQTHLGVVVTYTKAQPSTPTYAFNKDRKQYYCDAIMRRLVPLRTGQNLLIGVTDVDLFVPDAPFVFGEADRESKVGGVLLSAAGGQRPGSAQTKTPAGGLATVWALDRTLVLRGAQMHDVPTHHFGGHRPEEPWHVQCLPQ